MAAEDEAAAHEAAAAEAEAEKAEAATVEPELQAAIVEAMAEAVGSLWQARSGCRPSVTSRISRRVTRSSAPLSPANIVLSNIAPVSL